MKYFTFSVKTCRHAKIALSQRPGITDKDTYIIALLPNDHDPRSTISFIDSEGEEEELQTYTDKYLLRCDSHRDFWITWHDQTLNFGIGVLDGIKLLGVDNVEMDITGVSVGTGPDTDGEWEFIVNEG